MYCKLRRYKQLLDFELAARNSILRVFSEATVQHCLFHFFQNLFKAIQRKGLVELYRDNLEARALLRCLPALAFLDPDEVRDGLEEVVEALNALLADDVIEQRFEIPLMGSAIFSSIITCENLEYLEYFQKTYVYQLRGPQRAQRLVDAIYPLRLWNVFDSVQAGLPRTNNSLEAWHRTFNAYFARGSMRLSNFLQFMRMEETTVRRRYQR